MVYEEATNDLRQVRTGTCVNIQRKWLVQNGERYEGEPRNPDDINITPDTQSCIFDGGIWLPAKIEWRDLPTIDISEV